MRKSLIALLILMLAACNTVNENADIRENYIVTIKPNYDFDMTPIQQGLKLFGEYEAVDGKPNPKLNNIIKRWFSTGNIISTPWCSGFIIECALASGYESSTSLAARSWLTVGKSSYTNPKPGDVIIFWRESEYSWKGHVGFFIKYANNGRGVIVYGGNQGNRVTFKEYPISRILDIRRLSKCDTTSIAIEDRKTVGNYIVTDYKSDIILRFDNMEKEENNETD